MKKIKLILVIMILSLCAACGRSLSINESDHYDIDTERNYTIVYKIYYNTNNVVTKTYHSTTGFSWGYTRYTNNIVSTGCFQAGGAIIEETTAPIQVIKCYYTINGQRFASPNLMYGN